MPTLERLSQHGGYTFVMSRPLFLAVAISTHVALPNKIHVLELVGVIMGRKPQLFKVETIKHKAFHRILHTKLIYRILRHERSFEIIFTNGSNFLTLQITNLWF